MQAPDRIYANASVGEGGFWACDASVYDQADCHEYHIARPGQPCSTDDFLDKVLTASDLDFGEKLNRILWWRFGSYILAMEGLQ